MATATKSATKPASKTASKTTATARKTHRKPAGPEDAIALLMADHKEVKGLFKDYEKLVKAEADADEKQPLAEKICMMLIVHATVEEELFYPAARSVLEDDEDLVDEADVEHAGAKELIAQIQASSPDGDDHYDAKVKVLGEYIDHHVKEEESEMFPKIKKTDLDLDTLGADMAARKEQLMAEMGELAEA